MEELNLVKEDCAANGYGRKKWWAEYLGVPQLTISHWLAARQLPNAKHLKLIQNRLNELQADTTSETLQDHLWELYYQGFNVEPSFIVFLTLEILEASSIEVRTLSLLSLFIENLKAFNFETPADNNLRNKLGWLLETAQFTPSFKPATLKAAISLIKVPAKPLNQDLLISYLKKHQTVLGEKWQVFDCSIDQIKESLIWKRNIDK